MRSPLVVLLLIIASSDAFVPGVRVARRTFALHTPSRASAPVIARSAAAPSADSALLSVKVQVAAKWVVQSGVPSAIAWCLANVRVVLSAMASVAVWRFIVWRRKKAEEARREAEAPKAATILDFFATATEAGAALALSAVGVETAQEKQPAVKDPVEVAPAPSAEPARAEEDANEDEETVDAATGDDAADIEYITEEEYEALTEEEKREVAVQEVEEEELEPPPPKPKNAAAPKSKKSTVKPKTDASEKGDDFARAMRSVPWIGDALRRQLDANEVPPKGQQAAAKTVARKPRVNRSAKKTEQTVSKETAKSSETTLADVVAKQLLWINKNSRM